MYTRSYPSPRPAVVRASLPPDYGGTALTEKSRTRSDVQSVKDNVPISDPTPSAQFRPDTPKPSVKAPFHNHAIENSDQNNKSSDNESTLLRRPYEKDTRERRSIRSVGRAPFGNIGQIEYEASEYDNNDITQDDKDERSEHQSLSSVIFPNGVQTDDLLLLGLIFLLYSESKTSGDESCKEAIMLLALLYISGL